ncbi:MAG: DHA2 family efflux MFS transporter permease subunit [Actinobacteria bacterium]|nr:DHA2 family efflux MFS transporter permease subunit [Actinomycetota bacterium]
MIQPDRVDARTAYERRWWALAMLCLSLIIVFAGNATLNVAIPTLSRDLHASTSELQWVVSIYSLVFAGALFTTGAVGDRFGRKGALQFGLLLYLAGSLLATLSTSMGELIACRALMGLAGAFIMPSTLSILINIFPAEERPKAIAIWSACIGAAPPLGPVVSGILLGHFWYGSVFLVNVPIIVVALAGGVFFVPTSRDPKQAAFDPPGAVTSIIGISALVYALIEAPDRGWGSPVTLVSFGAAVVALLAFVLFELRTEEPMLDIRYFKNRAFSTGTGGMILVFLGMYGTMFLVIQYLQLILGYSALSTSIRILPMTPIMMIVAPLTPRLSARYGANRTVATGMTLTALGFLMFTLYTPHTPYLYVLVSLIPFMTGIALTMSPMTSAIMSAVPPRRAGAGSAMNDATRELGAALGVAVLGSIAASRYSSSVHSVVTKLPTASQRSARSSLAGALQVARTLPGQAGAAVTQGAQHAFVGGIHLASTVGVALTLVAAMVVWRNLPVEQAHADSPEEVAAFGGELALDASEIPA